MHCVICFLIFIKQFGGYVIADERYLIQFYIFYGSTRILHIDPMWVTTGELAGSMKPGGKLSNTVAEIGISVLRDSCPDSKIIFPWIVTSYLIDRKFHTNVLKNFFRRDAFYKLSHKRLVKPFSLIMMFVYFSFFVLLSSFSPAGNLFFDLFYSFHSFLSPFFRSLECTRQLNLTGTWFR